MPARRPRRARGRVTFTPLVRELEGVLEVGRPSPTGRAVSQFQIQELGREAAATWPTAQSLTVAAFARWPWDEPRPEGGYAGFSETKQEESYGHQLGGVSPARRYFGWRSGVYSAAYFTVMPNVVVRDVLDQYEGRTPVRCVTVRPYE